MAKRKIEAKKFRRDVRAGLSVPELAKKYELSESKVKKYIDRFIAEGKLEPTYSDRKEKTKKDEKKADAGDQAPYEPTIELATVCDKCGTLKLADSDQCPKCDLGKSKEAADDGTIEFDLDGDTEHLAKAWAKDMNLGDIADQVSVTHDIQVDPDLAYEASDKKRFKAIHLIPVLILLVLLGVAGGVYLGVIPKPAFLKDDTQQMMASARKSKPAPVKRETRKPRNAPRQNPENQKSAKKVEPRKEQVIETQEGQKINQADSKTVDEPKKVTEPNTIDQPKAVNRKEDPKTAVVPLSAKADVKGAMSAGLLRIAMIDAEAVHISEILNEQTPAPGAHDEPLDQIQDYSQPKGQEAKEETTNTANKIRQGDDTEFLVAVTDGDLQRVKDMLAKGVDADSMDKNGNTALMLAAGMGDLQMARLLLKHGANVHTKNYDGLTALGWAYSPMGDIYVPLRERRAVVRLLKEHTRRANGGLAVSPIIAPR